MTDLVDLIIYKQYLELIFYTENICVKYPKSERYSLTNNIKNTTYEGMKSIIKAQKERDKKVRLTILNNIDTELKMIKVYIRISYKRKFITVKNYCAWSKKITNISNMLGGWINSCVRQ